MMPTDKSSCLPDVAAGNIIIDYSINQSTPTTNDVFPSKAYIACSWGIHHVGFVTICFGVCGAIMAVLVGPLVKCISQMSVLILAACINVTTCGLLYVWEPTPDNVTTYFVFAGVWGMADAIWWSQITALYGLMFPNDREAAFSNFFFWSFLGFFLCYSYANYFSVAVKIDILLFFLITGIICYLIGQIKIKWSPRREYVVIEDE
ncbi:Protein unc-93-like protein, partial [Stegodyphus mimosarum]